MAVHSVHVGNHGLRVKTDLISYLILPQLVSVNAPPLWVPFSQMNKSDSVYTSDEKYNTNVSQKSNLEFSSSSLKSERNKGNEF